MYNMYKQYGLAPFQAAAEEENWRSAVLFYYLQHRIKADNLVLSTKLDWLGLLQAYVDITPQHREEVPLGKPIHIRQMGLHRVPRLQLRRVSREGRSHQVTIQAGSWRA